MMAVRELLALPGGKEAIKSHPKVAISARHFERALAESAPSIHDDLKTLQALRSWNQRFGEGPKRRENNSMGFSPPAAHSQPHLLVR
jgi:hypothetical protein